MHGVVGYTPFVTFLATSEMCPQPFLSSCGTFRPSDILHTLPAWKTNRLSLSPATLSSSSWGTPRCSQARWDISSGSWTCPVNLLQESKCKFIQEAFSVLTDWYESPGNYTSVGSLTASLIPLNMLVLLGVKWRSLRVVSKSPMPSVNDD